MIAACDTGNCSGKRDLSANTQFYCFHKHTAWVFVFYQLTGIDRNKVNITAESIEKIHFILIFQDRNDTLIEIEGFKIFQ